MSFIDVIFLVVFLASVFIGFWRGFTREVISLISLVLALVLARHLSPSMTEVFYEWFDLRGVWVSVCAFVAIFLLVLVAGKLVVFLVQSFTQGMGLQSWERLGGSVFGFLRAMLILLMFSLVLDLTPFTREGWAKNSYSIQVAQYVTSAVSLEWSQDQIEFAIDSIDEKIQAKVKEGVLDEVSNFGDQVTEQVIDKAADIEQSGKEAVDKVEAKLDELDKASREKIEQISDEND